METPNPFPPVPPPHPYSPVQATEFSAGYPAVIDPRGENPAWNFMDVVLITMFAIVSQVLILAMAMTTAHSIGRFHKMKAPELVTNPAVLLSAELGGYLLLIGFMAYFLRAKYSVRLFSAVRWNMPRLEGAAIALGSGVAFAIFGDVVSNLLSRWIPKSLPIDELFKDTSSAYMVAVFGIFVAPFVEELFFRGLLYPVLAQGLGVVWAVLLTAAAFAAIHSPQLAHAWVPLTIIMLFSLMLTVVRHRTKSVAITMLIHMGYNATLFAQLFLVTQGFKHMDRA